MVVAPAAIVTLPGCDVNCGDVSVCVEREMSLASCTSHLTTLLKLPASPRRLTHNHINCSRVQLAGVAAHHRPAHYIRVVKSAHAPGSPCAVAPFPSSTSERVENSTATNSSVVAMKFYCVAATIDVWSIVLCSALV